MVDALPDLLFYTCHSHLSSMKDTQICVCNITVKGRGNVVKNAGKMSKMGGVHHIPFNICFSMIHTLRGNMLPMFLQSIRVDCIKHCRNRKWQFGVLVALQGRQVTVWCVGNTVKMAKHTYG